MQCLYFRESTSLSLGDSSKRTTTVPQVFVTIFLPFAPPALSHSINNCYEVSFASYSVDVTSVENKYHRERANAKQDNSDICIAKIKLEFSNL